MAVQQGRSENSRHEESLPISYASLRGSDRGCPRLRGSNEHIPLVRVLRARRAPGHSLLSFSASCCYSTTTAVPLALTISMVLLVPIVS